MSKVLNYTSVELDLSECDGYGERVITLVTMPKHGTKFGLSKQSACLITVICGLVVEFQPMLKYNHFDGADQSYV